MIVAKTPVRARGATALMLVALMVAALVPAAERARAAEPRIIDPIVVESFDGTPIIATLMLPAESSRQNRVPAVLMTHGWGGSRTTEPGGDVARLLRAGIAVLTWDSRGFGDSGGEANVGSPDFEVKDASALIDYLAKRPDIRLDAAGDPRVGWMGVSNAAGVQFNTAAFDKRVDAIVPIISWGDLPQDLVPNDVVKQTWDDLLYAAGAAAAALDGADSPAGPQTGVYAQEIHTATAEIAATGAVSEETRKWFGHKSTTVRSGRIDAPTLIIQGSVDTLFPLEDGFANYRNLVAAGTPVKLMTYCGGHTLSGCSYPGADSGRPGDDSGRPAVWQDRTVAWLKHYLTNARAATGAKVEWQAQDGYYYRAPRWPLPGTNAVAGPQVEATLLGPGPGGGDGPDDGNPAPDPELGTSAVREVVFGPARRLTPVLGVPKAAVTGEVTGLGAQLFFELVDVGPNGARTTVDDQVMPIKLESGKFRRKVALHGVSWIVKPGHSIELEITTGSTSYAVPRTGPFQVSVAARTTLPIAPSRWAAPSLRSN